MSVKAKEIVKKESVTYRQLLIVFALLIALQLFAKYIQGRISDATQIAINSSIIIATVIILLLLTIKVLPRYELMVLDKDFLIYKSLILKQKLIFAVPLAEILSLEKKFEKGGNITGKKLNYTLWGIKDRLTYIITFKKEGKPYQVHFQASKKFIDKLEKTINKQKI